MHLVDRSCGFMGSTSIVAGSIPVGVGLAWAKKLRKEPGIVAICFGDAAFEEGVTQEAMNFAALHKLPVLFYCENNRYSCYTQLGERQPKGRSAWPRYLSKRKSLASSVAVVRGGRPAVCEVKTYRFVEHCGPSGDDHLGYRPEAGTQRDPLLESVQTFNGHLAARFYSVIKDEIDEAFALAKSAAFPAKLMRPLCDS